MVAIINRTPTGRIISLHAEIQYLDKRFGNNPFVLNSLKYDATAEFNPLQFFKLAKANPSIGLYDPYLQNPLNPAKFHLTQSIQHDTQKSKSASDCANALEALGWINKSPDGYRVTESGRLIANVKYESQEFFASARSSVLGYGVFIGFLYKCKQNLNSNSYVERKSIEIGYQDTHETISLHGQNIPISSGSEKDTIIRTRSTLFAWAITTGFALPEGHKVPTKKTNWHIETLDEIQKSNWNWSRAIMFIPEDLFNGTKHIERPLSYEWMTKSTRSLRERGQVDIRNASLGEELKLKNRRFALVFILALASINNKKIDLQKVISQMILMPNFFVISPDNFAEALRIEMDICIVSGIPFLEINEILTTLTIIDPVILSRGAPKEIIDAATIIYGIAKI